MSEARPSNSCSSCRFSKIVTERDVLPGDRDVRVYERLECWRFPPVPLSFGTDRYGRDRVVTKSPRVEAEHWCGEFVQVVKATA